MSAITATKSASRAAGTLMPAPDGGDLSHTPKEDSNVFLRQEFITALKDATAQSSKEEKNNVVAHVFKTDPLLGLETALSLGLELKDLALILRRKDIDDFQGSAKENLEKILRLGLTKEQYKIFKSQFPKLEREYRAAVKGLTSRELPEKPLPENFKKLFELYFAPQFKEKRYEAVPQETREDLCGRVGKYFSELESYNKTVTLKDRRGRSEEVPSCLITGAAHEFLARELKDNPGFKTILQEYWWDNIKDKGVSLERFSTDISSNKVLDVAFHRGEILRRLCEGHTKLAKLHDQATPGRDTRDLLKIVTVLGVKDAFDKVVRVARDNQYHLNPLIEGKRKKLIRELRKALEEVEGKEEGGSWKTNENQRLIDGVFRETRFELREEDRGKINLLGSPTMKKSFYSYVEANDNQLIVFNTNTGEYFISKRGQGWLNNTSIYECLIDGQTIKIPTPKGYWKNENCQFVCNFYAHDDSDRIFFATKDLSAHNNIVCNIYEINDEGVIDTGIKVIQDRNYETITFSYPDGREVKFGDINNPTGVINTCIYHPSGKWILDTSGKLVIISKEHIVIAEHYLHSSDNNFLFYFKSGNDSFIDINKGAIIPTSDIRRIENMTKFGDGYLIVYEDEAKLLRYGSSGFIFEVEILKKALGGRNQPLVVNGNHSLAVIDDGQKLHTIFGDKFSIDSIEAPNQDLTQSLGNYNGKIYFIDSSKENEITLTTVDDEGKFKALDTVQGKVMWLNGIKKSKYLTGEICLCLTTEDRNEYFVVNDRFVKLKKEKGSQYETPILSYKEDLSSFSIIEPLTEQIKTVRLLSAIINALEENSRKNLSPEDQELVAYTPADPNKPSAITAKLFTKTIQQNPTLAVGNIPLSTVNIQNNRLASEALVLGLLPGLKKVVDEIRDIKSFTPPANLSARGSFDGMGGDPLAQESETLATLSEDYQGMLITGRLSRFSETGFSSGSLLATHQTVYSNHAITVSCTKNEIALAAPLNGEAELSKGTDGSLYNSSGVKVASSNTDQPISYFFREATGSFKPLGQEEYEEKLLSLTAKERLDLLNMPLKLPVSAKNYLEEISGYSPAKRAVLIQEWIINYGYYETEYAEYKEQRKSMPLQEKLDFMQTRLSLLRREREAFGEDTKELEGKEFSGVCADYTILTIAMLRKSGILAEVITGFTVSGDTIESKNTHSCAAIYLLDSDGNFRSQQIDATPGLEGAEPRGNKLLKAIKEEVKDEKSGKSRAKDLDALNKDSARNTLPKKLISEAELKALQAKEEERMIAHITHTLSRFDELFNFVNSAQSILDFDDSKSVESTPEDYLTWMLDSAKLLPEFSSPTYKQHLKSALIFQLQNRFQLTEQQIRNLLQTFPPSL